MHRLSPATFSFIFLILTIMTFPHASSDHFPAKVVDLGEFAFEQASVNQGALPAYRALLEKIHSGNLLDERNKVKARTEGEKQRLQARIDQCEQEIKELQSEKADIHRVKDNDPGRIQRCEQVIAETEQSIDTFLNDTSRAKALETFRWSRFLPPFLILLFLTVYLFSFYTGVAYNALNGIDVGRLLDGDKLALGILPTTRELGQALGENWLLVFVPVILIGVGMVLHTFLEKENLIHKIAGAAGTVLLTFLFDGIIAYKIHGAIMSGFQLMLEGPELDAALIPWYRSVDFWLVIFLGFIVSMVWSVLFHVALTEWEKRHLLKNWQRIIDRQKAKIHALRDRSSELQREIEKRQTQKEQLERERDRKILSSEQLQENIQIAQEAWITYLGGKYRADDKKREAKMGEVITLTQNFLNEVLRTVDDQFT